MATFSKWLSDRLGQRELDVQRLLRDETALQFLITWSIFESKCFSGFLRAKCLRTFSNRICTEGFDETTVEVMVRHFHNRYKDKKMLKNLLHDEKTPVTVFADFERCLGSSAMTMQTSDQAFLAVFVVYRFRNNMFHGNKRVDSWLRYGEQISMCTSVMQIFVNHSEHIANTMKIPEAA